MTNADKLTDMERLNESLRNQVADNDHQMTRFAEEIRQLDVQIDRKQREQDLLDQENQALKSQLDALKHLEAKFEQIKISLEEETQRRANADAEGDRLRM